MKYNTYYYNMQIKFSGVVQVYSTKNPEPFVEVRGMRSFTDCLSV